jgi:sugar lactone lactonase YvrE
LGTNAEIRLSVAASTADILGESPTWIAQTGHLFWVDLRRPALHRLDPVTGHVASWPMPELIGAVVPRASGGVVVALKHAIFAFDPVTGDLSRIATVEHGPEQNRLNDAKCDSTGRLFCGSMWDYGLRTTGGLYRIDAAGAVVPIRREITVANAIAFSPHGRTLYFADTRRGTVEQAAYDPVTGSVGAWTEFARADAAPGSPDGATVDAEGYLWNARYKGSCVARFAPDGRLDRIVELPVSQPTSCAFGGSDLRTLFVTTATQKLDAAQLASQPLAGSLLALDVGVAGLPEPGYAG